MKLTKQNSILALLISMFLALTVAASLFLLPTSQVKATSEEIEAGPPIITRKVVSGEIARDGVILKIESPVALSSFQITVGGVFSLTNSGAVSCEGTTVTTLKDLDANELVYTYFIEEGFSSGENQWDGGLYMFYAFDAEENNDVSMQLTISEIKLADTSEAIETQTTDIKANGKLYRLKTTDGSDIGTSFFNSTLLEGSSSLVKIDSNGCAYVANMIAGGNPDCFAIVSVSGDHLDIYISESQTAEIVSQSFSVYASLPKMVDVYELTIPVQEEVEEDHVNDFKDKVNDLASLGSDFIEKYTGITIAGSTLILCVIGFCIISIIRRRRR